MKKYFPLIASILLFTLSLTSCSTLMDGAVNDPTEPPAPVTTPTGGEGDISDSPTESTEPAKPAKPEMLGYDANGFSLWPEGNYLADPKFDTDEYLPDFDTDPGFLIDNGTNTFDSAACSTGDTAYAVTMLNLKSSFLLYMDKATGITLPLCWRPECTHRDENCNAYLGQDSYCLQIYDGKIYWATIRNNFKYELMRMDLDGSNHERVMELSDEVESVNGILHRGCLYFALVKSTVSNGEAQTEYKVLAQPLDGGEMFTVLDQTRPSGSSERCFAIPSGNELTIILTGRRTDGTYIQIFRWSSKTRTSELLFASEDWELEMSDRPYLVPGDGLYFAVSNTLTRFSFEDRTFEEVCTLDLENAASPKLVTGEHIAVCEHYGGAENSIGVYDYDGNMVTETGPLGKHLWILIWTGEDEKYVYLQYAGGTNEKNIRGVLLIPLDGGEVVDIEWTIN